MEEKRWYVLWSSADRNINLIHYLLCKYDVQIWNPCFKQINNSGEEKTIPIFPGYFLIYCMAKETIFIEDHCKDLKYLSMKFLREENGKPIPITNEEINHIKDLELMDIKIKNDYNLNDTILIEYGPLKGLNGKVIDIKENYLNLQVVIFQRELQIWVKTENCIKI